MIVLFYNYFIIINNNINETSNILLYSVQRENDVCLRIGGDITGKMGLYPLYDMPGPRQKIERMK